MNTLSHAMSLILNRVSFFARNVCFADLSDPSSGRHLQGDLKKVTRLANFCRPSTDQISTIVAIVPIQVFLRVQECYFQEKSSETATVYRTCAPHVEENRYSSLSLDRFIAESNGISKKAQDILEASWRPSTRKRYAGYLQRFTQQSTQHQWNEIPLGELLLLCRFLKGVFNLRPALPRYSTTWDVSVALKYIKSLKALKQCDLKSVLYFLAILLFIITRQRDQTLLFLNIDLMMFEADKVTTFVPELLKQSRTGHHLDPMVLLRYPDQEISVVSHLEQYIEKTKDLLKDSNPLLLNLTNALQHQPSLGGA